MSGDGGGGERDPFLAVVEDIRRIVLGTNEACLQLATLYVEQRRRVDLLEAALAEQARERKDLHDLVEHLVKKVGKAEALGSRVDVLEVSMLTGKRAGKG